MFKDNAKALSTSVPSIKSTLAPCRGLFYLFSLLSRLNYSVILACNIFQISTDMAFQPDTILLPDSSPFLSVPTYHQAELPDLRHSEILYQSINLMIISHICHCCCYILSSLFIVSFSLHDYLICYKLTSHQLTPGYTLPTFSLSAIYRCVTRSCNRVVRKNLYHRKLSCIPFLSRYSCRNFSLSSSVGAVLNLLYISRFTIASSFCSKPNRIFSSPS